ncbi:hypothetical protein, partial [Staphylococcus aureus]
MSIEEIIQIGIDVEFYVRVSDEVVRIMAGSGSGPWMKFWWGVTNRNDEYKHRARQLRDNSALGTVE